MKQAEARVWTVDLGGGWTARAGRSDVDNDILTFRESFPQDLWLHAKACPGSHVVLHHPEQRDAPRDILEAAARVALKYSKARRAGRASVTVARIADLAKARGAPAGQVTVRKAKTVTVRNDAEASNEDHE